MVTKQTLLAHEIATIEEYFEIIFSIIYIDTDESIVLFNLLSVPQKMLFFRYIADNYYDEDCMSYPMRELKELLLQDDE
tara:strand:- start:1118 stop:1354 length:237 start_codon:yes stop_codon:yes gene_type:complete